MEVNNNPFQDKENKEELKENNNEENIDKESEINEEVDSSQNTEENTDSKEDEYKLKYEDLNNKYIRLAADFDNFRKRTAAERESLLKYGCADILKKLATVLDTFDRAQEQLKNIDNIETVRSSYEVAFKQLSETLKKAGMEEIDALGKEFNPNEHEAVTQIPTNEYAPDCVAAVMQKGYKYLDRVLRPAMVGVAKELEEQQENSEEEAK